MTGLKVASMPRPRSGSPGIFMLVPPIGMLSLIGLYSVYTLAIGLPIVTGCPPDESVWFVGAIVLCYVLIAILVAVIERAVPGRIRSGRRKRHLAGPCYVGPVLAGGTS